MLLLRAQECWYVFACIETVDVGKIDARKPEGMCSSPSGRVVIEGLSAVLARLGSLFLGLLLLSDLACLALIGLLLIDVWEDEVNYVRVPPSRPALEAFLDVLSQVVSGTKYQTMENVV